MSGLCSTSTQVWMLSWRGMLQGSLFLLMTIVAAANGNGKQVENTQRNQTLSTQLWELTSNWMEHQENDLKNSRETVQKVLNQFLPIKDQMQKILFSIVEQEKHIQIHRDTLKSLHDHNSYLNPVLLSIETQQQAQLEGVHYFKTVLQGLMTHINSTLTSIQDRLQTASSTFSFWHQNQHYLMEMLQNLIHLVNPSPGVPLLEFQSCEDIRRSGLSEDKVYTILNPNLTEPKRVFCVMDTDGGAWTVIQRRVDGTENFQRNWQDYKQGFGDPAGEHWLGNEVVHQLTKNQKYTLRVEMEDWENNTFSATFANFQLEAEEQFYRIFLNQYNGFTSHRKQLILGKNPFSTHDADHDRCPCNCAQDMSGGWWFDRCSISNLNGKYYPAGQHLDKLDGIHWPRSVKGPIYSLRSSRMMIRPMLS